LTVAVAEGIESEQQPASMRELSDLLAAHASAMRAA
jgi:hypothetical protein